MRWISLLLISLALILPVSARQTVERTGWEVLSFDVPGMELLGIKDSRSTRATFGRKVGRGEVKITVFIKSWMAIDTFESKFREDKLRARASGESRLRPDVEIPGADKVLVYTDTAPYEAAVIVLYTKDFRCQLSVTSSKDAIAEIEPTYNQLVKTLSMKGISKISPTRVE